jgi:hypothetical protein
MESLPRSSIKQVLLRMRKPSGLPTDDKTAETYTSGMCRIKTLGLANVVADPDALYETLKGKFTKAPTMITLTRSCMMFLGNLNEEERKALRLPPDLTEILRKYARHLTTLTALRKAQQAERKVQAQEAS